MENFTFKVQTNQFILAFIILCITSSSLQGQSAFITTWKTTNPGTTNNSSITIPTYGHTSYNYDVDWNNDGVFDEFGLTDSVVHDFGTPGIYTIRIRGTFPRIFFDNKGDKEKIIDIVQWGDIEWRSMNSAFQGCINLTMSATDAPDLSIVKDLTGMFQNCALFNSPVEHWDVSNVEKFYLTFGWCLLFNQPLNNWNMSNATSIDRTFLGCESFNQPLDKWDVSKVTNFGATFQLAKTFNQPLSSWDTRSARIMGAMFSRAHRFNQDISSWDVSQVYNMAGMFYDANDFNQPIGNWDVGNVTRMMNMFKRALSFEQDLSEWNVSKVTDMGWMFASAQKFNSDIGDWDVSNVTDMEYMFFHAKSFNQDIGEWDVSKVTSMQNMFKNADTFNQDIGNWDVGNVTSMTSMFEENDIFDQNLGRWDVRKVTNFIRMFNRATLSIENYDSLLIGWNRLELPANMNFHGGYSLYCAGREARANMIARYGWTITDAGRESGAPIAICQDIEITLDPNGNALIAPDMLNNSSSVSCGDILFEASQTAFSCENIGENLVNLTIRDIHGDSSRCTSNVVVRDAPFELKCPDNITAIPNSIDCSAFIIWEEPVGTCLIKMQSSHQNGDIFPLGITTVTLSATNEQLHTTTSCSFDVTIASQIQVELDSVIAPYPYEKEDGQIFINIQGGSAPYSIDWDIDGQGDFDDEQNLYVSQKGLYTALVRDSYGCIDTVSVQVDEVEVPCEEFDFKIYPNPSYGSLSLDIKSCKEDFDVEIFDILGRRVYEDQLLSTQHSLDLQGLAAGGYIFRLRNDNKFIDKRLIVIK